MSEAQAVTPAAAPPGMADTTLPHGAIVDPAVETARAERAAARKAAAAAAFNGASVEPVKAPVAQETTDDDGEAEVAAPKTQLERAAEKTAPKEEPEAQAEKPGDRVRKYLAERQEKAEAAKLKAEIASLREQQEKALEQARVDARREAFERVKKQPKAAFEEYGLDPSGLVQSAMDEITTDPVRKLELQLEQQKSEHQRAMQELRDLRDGLSRRELQQQAESGQRYVLGFARQADAYPLLNARYENDGALLQEYFGHAKEYHARTGEMPPPEEMLAYMEDRERAVYSKVYGAVTPPKAKANGKTRGLSPADANARASGGAVGPMTPEQRKKAAEEAFLKATR